MDVLSVSFEVLIVMMFDVNKANADVRGGCRKNGRVRASRWLDSLVGLNRNPEITLFWRHSIIVG
jgi:hypothetical protein